MSEIGFQIVVFQKRQVGKLGSRDILFPLIRFVSLDLATIQLYRSAGYFVLDGIVGASYMLRNSVYGPAVFQPYFNFMPLFRKKVLTFSVFCGIIGIVHSGDSFLNLVCQLNSTTESLLWMFF